VKFIGDLLPTLQLPAPVVQMPLLAGAFLPLLGGLVMLNAPTNLSGLLPGFVSTVLLAFLQKFDCQNFEWFCLEISKQLISISCALLPHLLFIKFQPTTAHLLPLGYRIPSSLVNISNTALPSIFSKI
jgi:hypothetical protein